MSADAEYLAQYDLDYNAWQSACSKKQSYNAWELTVLRYMKWWLLDPGQALADATSSISGFDKLVADSTDKLKQITELQEAGAWGPKNKVHIHQILTTELLYQLTRMYGLELELATPHQRVDGWLRTFLSNNCQANLPKDLVSNQAACHELALWYQVTIVHSSEDTWEARQKVDALRRGAVEPGQIFSYFKGRFEALQDQWIRFVHLFGLQLWPMYNQYKAVADQFAEQDASYSVAFKSQFMNRSFSMQSSQFYSAVIAALPHMYWSKTKQIINTFFLARLLFLLITQEPSLCKGLLSYASAIMFLDFKRVYISYAGILNSNLVQLLEHLQVVVNLHMVENETLLHFDD